MKVTQVLHKQHIYKMFVKHWMIQGKKVPRDTGAHKALLERGIAVHQPEDIVFQQQKET